MDFADGGAAGIAVTDPAKDANGGTRIGKRMIDKKIVLFGTGAYFENYIMCHRLDGKRLMAVDNDASKVGTVKCGIEIASPKSLRKLEAGSFYVVICCADWRGIAEQLEQLGIYDYQYYRPIPVEQVVPTTLSLDGTVVEVCFGGAVLSENAAAEQNRAADGVGVSGKPYKIGYVPGVFDLFHVGHLNLLRNAKSRCEYLIAGVLTDELVEHFKNRRPVIPYEQRAAVVEAVKYVDRVVPVDFSNTRKIDAWNRYHYDCHFSGNDHGADWYEDFKSLKEVGSNMEFFEYTSATSTTQIRKIIN